MLPSMTQQLMIQAAGLAKTFTGRRGTVEAVRGVDLAVAAGEIVGFLGPNGAGKTTTLRMLTTLLAADRRPGQHRRPRPAHRSERGPRGPSGMSRRAAAPARMPGCSTSSSTRRSSTGSTGSTRRTGPTALLTQLDLTGLGGSGRQDPLRRAAPAPGHRAGPGPHPVGGLPRRADHRPRPAEPFEHVGAHRAACAAAPAAPSS